MTTATRPFYPTTGVEFKLTLDGDAHPPLEMVRRDGYYLRGWRHKGPVVKGAQTKRFKLVKVGYCPNFEEVRRRLTAHGEIPEGQWREAFRAAYAHDDQGSIGIADASWVGRSGDARFPYVGMAGHSDFDRTVHGFGGDWRWLVVCK